MTEEKKKNQKLMGTWTIVGDPWNGYDAIYDGDGELVAYRGDAQPEATDILDALSVPYERRDLKETAEAALEKSGYRMPDHLDELKPYMYVRRHK